MRAPVESVVVVVVVGMVRVVIGGVVIVPEDSVVALLVSGTVDIVVASFSDVETQAELSNTMISGPVRYRAYFVLDISYPPYVTLIVPWSKAIGVSFKLY